MSSVESLKEQIAQLGDKIRQLKLEKADKETVTREVAVLTQLKSQLAQLTGEPLPTAGGSGSGKKSGGGKKAAAQFTLKTPKGTRDFNDKEMAVRDEMFATIKGVFQQHGGVTIDTPVFELKEILSGKYGEDSKLIYDLEDQGGEKCSLRYDLTVPFSRFLAMNSSQYPNIKRYHIGKVYRRDQPAMTKGRMREFFQCDFDIAGTHEPMVPDAEIVRIAVDVLTALDVGDFMIKINHRQVLDGMFQVCGVPADKIRPISSAVDKMDKSPWEEVRREMVEDKGLDPAVADRIGTYICLSGGEDLLAKLQQDADLMANPSATAGLKDMALFFRYAKVFKMQDKVLFDLSLARGLDYYTGVIYEAILVDSEENQKLLAQDMAGQSKAPGQEDESQARLGSIAAGGRYDELVGMFAGTSKKGKSNNIPCVGVSVGVERVFSILMRKRKLEEIKANRTEVYIISVGDGLLEERMAIAAELWDHGIKAEYMFKAKPKLPAQWAVCDRDLIPLSVIIGRDELEKGVVKIKDMINKTDSQSGGNEVPYVNMVAEIKKRLGQA
ncbi:histidyl-tRNA synthetase [Dimargaris cristalligena]|uniref:Histidine--tRNA ligase, mitochondrial n=1 Tax=Dimargaris cristalligena TaxID=215637 RepID=A0A4P9ZLI9_9FUNG|nr:histidyl-tRNA synthetase [Dimargaris cristalligena]|eukprot:RKP34147.1 histidyl-tRNA synthetase [Dimargaris cristalligena]